ncbi:hypothetical protein D3C80_1482390 [compost metagenome]
MTSIRHSRNRSAAGRRGWPLRLMAPTEALPTGSRNGKAHKPSRCAQISTSGQGKMLNMSVSRSRLKSIDSEWAKCTCPWRVIVSSCCEARIQSAASSSAMA